jgi:chromosome partitioning protein
LAREGIKTLLVDIDAQCNSTTPLLGSNPANNVAELLQGTKDVANCVQRLDFDSNFWCLPNAESLTDFEPTLIAQGQKGFTVLSDKIKDYCEQNFEITIIDCPPNFGIFVINALYCSQLAIVPIEAGSKNSVMGLLSAQKFIQNIQSAGNEQLNLFRVLITKLDKRTKIGKDYLTQIQNAFSEYVFKTHIPATIDFKYAENMGQTIFQNSPKSAGTKAYRAVVKETLEALGIGTKNE